MRVAQQSLKRGYERALRGRSRTAAPDEPGAECARCRKRDRPERARRDRVMKSVERRGGGRCRGSREADDRLGGGLAGPVAARTGRAAARSGAAAPGRPTAIAPVPPAPVAPPAPVDRPVCGGGWLAGDDGGGVGATTVGVLNRRDISSCRRSGCCKGQKADRSGDLRPHDAELSSWSYGRRLVRPSSGRNLRRVPAASRSGSCAGPRSAIFQRQRHHVPLALGRKKLDVDVDDLVHLGTRIVPPLRR